MAKEYIEREAAIQKIRTEGVLGSGYSDTEREEDVIDMLTDLPAADVVEVVRCKDCKYYGDEHFCPLLSLADYTDPHDFCSYGERRDNNAQTD